MTRSNGLSNTLVVADLERYVLGAALLDHEPCSQVVMRLKPEYMADAKNKHGAILATITKLYNDGETVNVFNVAQAGPHDHNYLNVLTSCVGSTLTSNIERYNLVIIERWMARETIRAAQITIGQLKDGDDIFDVMDAHQSRLSSFMFGDTSGTHIKYGVDKALETVKNWRKGISSDLCPTGIYGLDRLIGGYPIGELTTVAGMTGSGKTAFISQVIKTLAKILRKKTDAVLVFSAEMSHEQLVHRMASSEAGVDLRDLRRGKATAGQYDTYDATLKELAYLNLHIDDAPAPTFGHITARCQQLQAQYGLAFVGVDYDEKINTEGHSEELRVSAIAQGLKNLAKRFYVPVVTLSQYSRAATHTSSPSDDWLRYSGKKEHESAVILHWFYPAHWVQRGMEPATVYGYDQCGEKNGFLICTKNRFGRNGKVPLEFEPEFTRFIDHNEPML